MYGQLHVWSLAFLTYCASVSPQAVILTEASWPALEGMSRYSFLYHPGCRRLTCVLCSLRQIVLTDPQGPLLVVRNNRIQGRRSVSQSCPHRPPLAVRDCSRPHPIPGPHSVPEPSRVSLAEDQVGGMRGSQGGRAARCPVPQCAPQH